MEQYITGLIMGFCVGTWFIGSIALGILAGSNLRLQYKLKIALGECSNDDAFRGPSVVKKS